MEKMSIKTLESNGLNALRLLALACIATILFAHAFVEASVGQRISSEKDTYVDPVTGITVSILTRSSAQDVKIYQHDRQWAADKRHVIFWSDRSEGDGQQLFAIDTVSGEMVQVTEGPAILAGSTNVAVSGEKMVLYYFSGRELIELQFGKLLEHSKGGDLHPGNHYQRTVATLPEANKLCGGISLDADEERLYLGVELEGGSKTQWALKSIDLETGSSTTVVDLHFRIGHVQANPWRAGEIMYCHETGGNAPQRMWLVNSDGSKNRPLYDEGPKEWVTHEVWADEDHVLFIISGHAERLRKNPHGVFSINVRSEQVDSLGQVPDAREALAQVNNALGAWHVHGTPDGRWAAVDNFDGDLFLINRVTGTRHLLTTGHHKWGRHTHQSFDPDGNRILFNSERMGNTDLMMVTIPFELRTER